MNGWSRRRFLQTVSAVGAGAALGLGTMGRATGATPGRVVIVGGGFGGATCARYLKQYAPDVEVTLIEGSDQYVTCPFSNTVISGMREIEAITVGYQRLEEAGISVLHDWVEAIDPANRQVRTRGGQELAWDRLVVSPGISFRWDAVEGYSPEAAERIPHAWRAGEQTLLLRRQLEAMENGGTVVIAAPPNPYRCPPGPYERAGLIAWYLKQNKPRSKVLIVDAKDSFPKQQLFMDGWEQLYPGMVEWVSGTEGGAVQRVDPQRRTLYLGDGGESVRGDVINLIPPQKAGEIAEQAGLTDDSGWCPVDPVSFESTRQPGIHVIGDACTAGLPKSGYSANVEGKVCARAVAGALLGAEVPEPSYINTCYSLLSPDYGISVAGVYRLQEGKIMAVEGAGGVSPADASQQFREREARFTRGWYTSIIADTFG